MAETPQRNRRNTWVIVVVVGAILLLLLCACLAAVAATGWFAFVLPWQRGGVSGIEINRSDRIGGQVEVQRTLEESFNVSTPVLLDVTNEVGRVIITGADQEGVTVQAVVRGYGNTETAAEESADQVNVEIQQVDDNQIRLEGDIPEGVRMGNSPAVDWIVRVPRDTRVQVRNNVGEVQVENIVGSLLLHVDVGEIRVRDFTMNDNSEITTNVGQITVELPADSAFVVEANTGVGNITSEFDVATTRSDRPGPGDSLEGPVGTNPEVTLVLRTSTGEINLLAD